MFTEKDLRNFIRKRIQAVEDIMLDRLKQVGEEFVADARSVNTYKDRTRNLRGSKGYVILKDGNEVFGNFRGVSEGVSEAKQFVRTLYGERPRGFAIIVVAGMEYAAAVESKGYDVITGSSQKAESNLSRSLNRLKESLSKLK